MLSNFTESILSLVQSLGYLEVFLLMTLESSFVPFPSEIVVPPAAYLAQQGQLNIFLVVLFGILGSLAGALINYFLALKLGRPVLYRLAETKLAKLFLINETKLQKSETYFLKHGSASTFFGRLVPVVRQLISIPAGLSRMNLAKFLLYTGLGSFIWISILAVLGYVAGEKQEIIITYYREIVIIILLLLVVFWLFKRLRKKKHKKIENKEVGNKDNENKEKRV
ncbi:MAG: DedA family protein [Candidatus Pacebacteria bacterium]|nr:DedA family protein [Candidatus Paceibacterota bacterium]